jgi:hypothetical protein
MAAQSRVSQSPHEPEPSKLVAPTTRVSVAFPFSHLHIEECGKEVAELAAMVAELASIVERLEPGIGADQLRASADALTVKLRAETR